jgi:hypothetical protein
MPVLTRWFVKTSFVYLILELLAGVILGAQAVWPFNPPTAYLFPSYFHLMAEGWITMLIIGVVFWMFPKYTLERPRRSEGLGWSSYILLNLGLLLRIISEPANAVVGAPTSIWAIMLTVAALLQWLGGMAFVVNSWGRVKEK